MIIDTIANASRYFSLHPSFAKAFDYISNTDLQNIAPGKYEIDGDNLRAIFSNKNGMTAEESAAKFECHDRNIDIQLCITGTETIGWKPRENCILPNGGYDTEKDVQFYSDAPEMHFQLRNGEFAIFFPEDVHAPMIGKGEIRKLVIKVKK
ncbi:MAG: YhcH/YjgK/YiaL family protein [Chitinophagaceae bacterium]|nr:YhcH/YjgK/YiaL family protein [Chitinophagaceae bacterium]